MKAFKDITEAEFNELMRISGQRKIYLQHLFNLLTTLIGENLPKNQSGIILKIPKLIAQLKDQPHLIDFLDEEFYKQIKKLI